MDFIAAKASAAREIALAFGVPPMLLGLPGDDTFANDAEANRSFWRQTVLPLVGRTAQALARWLAPDRLDDAVDRVRNSQPNLSASQYGTAVHLDLANQIRNLKDPNFIAEKSYFKLSRAPASYGARGSVRVDVLEDVDGSTVCVYDIKTGDEVIRPGRAKEIAQAVKTNFKNASRIILTEIRPVR